ncbi:hypothetical protein O3597_24735 [Verrucosispora sp. WMMA2044]|uniref:hypothetical protein n=1 Tax=Verrucosispora sp. WMMA2044 TaxID=3016419 RepID=UPI00248B3177|nr:hypothetical protein [Verrucosispora sp. WMMA2044]WBB48274.1 hypothetical protein O3597_24735 [Verrucosispora sp. WMMA2044]
MTMSPRPALGLPLLTLLGLALLGLPRVVLHDLDLVHEGTFVNLLLVVVPPIVWITVALVKRVPDPFLTLLVVGLLYGVLLALTHQLLWHVAFDEQPTLGGNLTDLAPEAQAVIVRFFAAISSLFTGVIVGVVTGLLAWVISRIRP